jgi:hypothetical protein
MKKLERDGKVAVLVSPGYGAGWSTWNSGEIAKVMTMDADIVQAVLGGDRGKAATLATEKGAALGESYVCVLGAIDLVVKWVPKGAAFEITEYDGSESLHQIGERDYFRA